MKSSNNDLKKRGMAGKADTEALQALNVTELLSLLQSGAAWQRTAAVIVLRNKCPYHNNNYVSALLERLMVEKALYTRLEIARTLEGGNESTALQMCGYLGKIGSNQHREVPQAVSKKKNFPLPRDFVARSLGRMDKSVAPVLFGYLHTADRYQLSELLDAIGYMVFYTPQLATEGNFARIRKVFEHYRTDELIVWKIAMCCSAFPLNNCVGLLNSVKELYAHPTIRDEALRSLRLMNVKY